jgi:hydroxymethylbilane synthase
LHDHTKTIRIGAVDSLAARWHADCVQKVLKKKYRDRVFEVVFSKEPKASKGDLDFIVWDFAHPSAKTKDGRAIGAVLKREAPGDALLSRNGYTLESLPEGATVATNNPRSKGQLLFARKDLKVVAADVGESTTCDAVVAPYLEIKRLGHEDAISEFLGFDYMLPHPGEGTIVIQCAKHKEECPLLAPLHDEKTYLAALAERSYLDGLGTSGQVPVAAFAQIFRKTLTLAGAVIAQDGSEKHLLQTTIDLPAEIQEARKVVAALGLKLAKIALEDGARELMEVRP